MAEKKKKAGLSRRFGARYGRRTKEKFSEIEQMQRRKSSCPYCDKQAVKRVAVGIWECRKCKSKFTGRAYTAAIGERR